MKRIKTWKRWAKVVDGELPEYLTDQRWTEDLGFTVRLTSEQRKRDAVFNAAMKVTQESGGGYQAAMDKLRFLCERARK